MARTRKQIKSRVLAALAVSTLVPMIVFGYITHRATVYQTLELAEVNLKEDSKTYALVLLERLQTHADESASPAAGLPILSLDHTNGTVSIGPETSLDLDEWLWDLGDSQLQRCIVINGAEYRCAGAPVDEPDKLAKDWRLALGNSFTPTFDLAVRTVTTRDQALQSLSLMMELYPVLAVLISLIVCGLANRFLDRRFEPLRQLETSAAAIAKGDYGTVVKVVSGDEFESLASAFNDMSSTLDASFERMKRLANIDRMILASTDLDEIITHALELAFMEGYRSIELVLWRDNPAPVVLSYRCEGYEVVKEHLDLDHFPEPSAWQDIEAMEASCRAEAHIDETAKCLALRIDETTAGFLLVTEEPGVRTSDYDTTDLVDKMAVAVSNGWRREDLFRQAHFDRLTGLINRPAFEDRLSYALTQAKRRNLTGAVLFMDLDRFKLVNDTEGHKAGDRLLVEVANRLCSCLREEDTVARFHGDEFGVLFPHYTDHSELVMICDRIISEISQPIVVDRIEHVVNVSIGAAIFPTDADNPDELLMLADAAMYRAKEASGGNASFYDKTLNEAVHARVAVESRLRGAVKSKLLELYFQPKMDLSTGQLPGAEGLLRWEDEELGFVAPRNFVSIAEDTGLIHEFLDICMADASKMLYHLTSRGFRDYRVAINASPKQLTAGGFSRHFLQTCARHGVSPNNLELEFTESVFVSDPESVTRELATIRDQGVAIALDDFGTGYSSLNMLRQLPIDVLKIDRSFIKDVATSRDAMNLVHHVIDIAQVLKKEVVAEGVESGEQFTMLKKVGCRFVQGYFISPPLKRAEFLRFVADHDRLRSPERSMENT